MATKCPHCGYANPDDLPFCNSCGEPIDAELRMVIGVKNYQSTPREKPKQRYDDEEYVPRIYEDEEEDAKSHKGILILAVVVVVAVLLWVLLK